MLTICYTSDFIDGIQKMIVRFSIALVKGLSKSFLFLGGAFFLSNISFLVVLLQADETWKLGLPVSIFGRIDHSRPVGAPVAFCLIDKLSAGLFASNERKP